VRSEAAPARNREPEPGAPPWEPVGAVVLAGEPVGAVVLAGEPAGAVAPGPGLPFGEPAAATELSVGGRARRAPARCPQSARTTKSAPRKPAQRFLRDNHKAKVRDSSGGLLSSSGWQIVCHLSRRRVPPRKRGHAAESSRSHPVSKRCPRSGESTPTSLFLSVLLRYSGSSQCSPASCAFGNS
jgi:hypothetical protein